MLTLYLKLIQFQPAIKPMDPRAFAMSRLPYEICIIAAFTSKRLLRESHRIFAKAYKHLLKKILQ
jgi:hypothetical protein